MSNDELPPAFRAMLGLDKPERERPAPAPHVDGEVTSRYAAAALRAECDRVACATEGTRNDTLNRAAFSLHQLVDQGLLGAEMVNGNLRQAALACGLTEREADATLTSAAKGAAEKPRPPVQQLQPRGPWEDSEHVDDSARRLILTSAATIKPRPVFWAWKDRLALGTLGLLAGREGLGKSTLAYWVTARLTRGELYGHHHGTPKSVLVCATEDSWEHTIVPRLMASGADLARVYRVEVVNAFSIHVGLSLPRDLAAVERAATDTDAALLLLDPLMSRLGALDTHRDAEVRQALEPLAALADRANMAVLGLIHHNKSGSADPLQLVMGSKAFTAVARSVHTVVPDPDDESDKRRLFGTPKNNLGRTDLPTFTFTIEPHPIETEQGTAWTGRLTWGDERADTIGDAMRRAAGPDEDRSAAAEAADWLGDYLAVHGGQVPSHDAKRDGRKAGHTDAAIRRARERLRLLVTSSGFPRVTYWELPNPVVSQSRQSPRGEDTTNTTDTTRAQSCQSCQSGQSCADGHHRDTTADLGGAA